MATLQKTYQFTASAEGWVFTSGGKGVGTYNATVQCLDTHTTGRNNTDNSWWSLIQTWEQLGVPSGATINSITVNSVDWRCDTANVSDGFGIGQFGIFDNVPTQQATLFALESFGGGVTSWATKTGLSNVTIPSVIQASATTVEFRLEVQLDNGNNASAETGVQYDNITFTIDYSVASTLLVIEDTVQSHTADNVTLSATAGTVLLVVQDTVQSQISDNVSVSVSYIVTVNDASHSSSVDDVIVSIYSSEYQAVLNEATTQVFTLPSLASRAKQDRIIRNLKTAGLWSNLDVFYWLKDDGDFDFKSINWRNPSNKFSLYLDVGVTNTVTGIRGGADLIDTNFNPTIDAVNYQLDNFSILWEVVTEFTNAKPFIISGKTALPYESVNIRNDAYFQALHNDADSNSRVNWDLSGTGHFIADYLTDTAHLAIDGLDVPSETETGKIPSNLPAEYWFLGRAGWYSDVEMGYFALGGSLDFSGANYANFYNALNSFDVDYQAVLVEATTQGYTLPSLANREIQNQIIVDLKSTGRWAEMDAMFHFKGDGDSNFKSINWKNPTGAKATEVGAGALTWANDGVQGDGTNYLNLGWNPTDDGVNYLQNDFSVWFDIVASGTGNLLEGTIGVSRSLQLRNLSTFQFYHSTGSGSQSIQDLSGTGFFILDFDTDTTYASKNGAASFDTESGKVTDSLPDTDFNLLKISATSGTSKIGSVILSSSLNGTTSKYTDAYSAVTGDSGGLIELIVSDTSHSQDVDNVVLDSKYNLISQESFNEHTVDSVILDSKYSLEIQDATHSQTSDSLVLVSKYDIFVNETLHNHTADNVILSNSVELSVDDAFQNSIVDNAVLTHKYSLISNDTEHISSVDNITINSKYSLISNDTEHSNTVDSVTVDSNYSLISNDTEHSSSADSVTVNSKYSLISNSTEHSSYVDSVIIDSKYSLISNDTEHISFVDSVTVNSKYNLVTNDTEHSSSADSVIIDSNYSLVTNDTEHSSSVDSVSLTHKYNVSPQETSHNHFTDSVVLEFGLTLSIQESYHTHNVDSLDLLQASSLIVNDTVHSSNVDDLSLNSNYGLAVQKASHGSTSDNIVLDSKYNLVANDTEHSSSVEGVTLELNNVLVVSDSNHLNNADSVVLTHKYLLVSNDSFNSSESDNVVLSFGISILINDTLHSSNADNVVVNHYYILNISNTSHSSDSDNVILISSYDLIISDALNTHTADNVTFSIGSTNIYLGDIAINKMYLGNNLITIK